MTRAVSVINVPHIAYSRYFDDGKENTDPFSFEGTRTIYQCELKIYVQYDDGVLDYFSVQYDDCLYGVTADELFLRPVRHIELSDVDEFIKGTCLAEKCSKEDATEYVVDLLRRFPSTHMSKEVRQKYGIPLPLCNKDIFWKIR